MLEFYRTETGQRNSKRSYFRTSREILDKVKKQVQLRKAPKKSMVRLIMNLVVYLILRHKEQDCETLIKYTGRREMLKKKRTLIQAKMLLMTLWEQSSFREPTLNSSNSSHVHKIVSTSFLEQRCNWMMLQWCATISMMFYVLILLSTYVLIGWQIVIIKIFVWKIATEINQTS